MWLDSGLQSYGVLCLPVPGGLQCCLVYFLSLPWCGLPQVLVFALLSFPPLLISHPRFPCRGAVTPYVGGGGERKRGQSQAHSLGQWVEPRREGPPGKEGAMETEGGVAEPAGQKGSH